MQEYAHEGAMAVELTYLGHAGFCVETEKAIIIMDPWLSPLGAFDSAWFQFPCNHHMAALVQEKLQVRDKERYIYISHEHKDHFDPAFLRSIRSRDFTFVIPQYRRTELYDALRTIDSKGVILLRDGEPLSFADGTMVIYIDDSEMDRDSAILIKAEGQSFLNLNDCKIHDRLADIAADHGAIDVFTAQFSGAVWHPVCYDYPKKVYQAISMRKRISKFEAVVRAIQTLQPKVYLTSAGPACFLDPMLIHLNFERINIFPRAATFLNYLKKRIPNCETLCTDPMPGDTLDVRTGQWLFQASDRVTEANFEAYIRSYAARFESFFLSRKYKTSAAERADIYQRLKTALAEKLEKLTLRDRVKIPLYFQFSDDETYMLRVDFPTGEISDAKQIAEANYYWISTPSWEVARVLDGRLTWEDFTLTFRMRLNRDPDVYHSVIHGFLMMEAEDMNYFCAKVLDAESKTERAIVEAGGKRYSIQRFCPHQGADLTKGWTEQDRYVVCPRHRWKYDLENGGECTEGETCTIRAFLVEDN